MPLSKNYFQIDEEDVNQMKTMLKKFYDLHQGAGVPDLSGGYVAYLPVFAIALLTSQESVDKLTKELVWLTRVITFFTVVLVALTLVLLLKAP